jgi:5'-3' exonuclease
MGVRGLQNFCRQYSTKRTFEDLLRPYAAKQRIGIDISFYIYKWLADEHKIVQFIRDLELNRHQVLLVFDGRAEDGKQWEAQRRRDVREQATKSAEEIRQRLDTEKDTIPEWERRELEREMAEQQKKGFTLTKELRNKIKERLYKEKIPMIRAKGEADGLLASLSSRGELDIVLSGDMDLLAMGTRSLWTPDETGFVFNEYNREYILQELKLTDWQFRSMCAVCFTEASEKQNKYDIRHAYQMMRVHGSLDRIKAKYPEWLEAWPEEGSHMFYRPIDSVDNWIRDDQLEIYRAFLNYEPMPYVN